MARPADFPPPFDADEFLAEATDPPDERIDVGALVVGAGPAGLAAAIRLAQLLDGRPDVRERLGEIPIAVVEKGRTPGAHLLSGAVVNPRALRQLFPGMPRDEMPLMQEVTREGVYFLTPKRAIRVPAPPTMWNHGNFVASVGELGGWLAECAEELGVTIVPETAAHKLLVNGGRVVGVRTGDRGRGRDGEELPNFEPGSDLTARVTILAEGTQGHLTGVAMRRFGLQPRPQVWALGVKEVWEVERPLERVIHTMGWPLRGGRRYREFGGSFIYPMRDNRVAIGLVVGLDYTDASLSVHDLLQELKGHPWIRRILDGGERIEWGAKTIPEGGFLALPESFHFPGGMIVGDGAGLVNVPSLKGIHYAMRSGMLAAETAFEAIQPGRTAWAPGALESYDAALRESYVWSDLERVRNMRPAFRYGFLGGALVAGAALNSRGKLPPRDLSLEPDAASDMFVGERDRTYPQPDGRLFFDKLSSVFLSGNKSRDDAPSHIRVQKTVPREVAEAWVRMCPAQVYEIAGVADGGENGHVHVEVTASNCVQCGAITAKGGRLTPAEGGSGPEYRGM
ncbi:MAG: electron transfer flavoprotein-ubiquinone oxidoreductase [Actinobacteria bacterium]|nr:electron transfer flavoprotein-ubiquinone oxidoreductase [Actinomycetota bacterium]